VAKKTWYWKAGLEGKEVRSIEAKNREYDPRSKWMQYNCGGAIGRDFRDACGGSEKASCGMYGNLGCARCEGYDFGDACERGLTRSPTTSFYTGRQRTPGIRLSLTLSLFVRGIVFFMIPLSGFLARNPPIAILSIQGIAIVGGFCSAWTKARWLECQQVTSTNLSSLFGDANADGPDDNKPTYNPPR
jgi:hypothetical protein